MRSAGSRHRTPPPASPLERMASRPSARSSRARIPQPKLAPSRQRSAPSSVCLVDAMPTYDESLAIATELIRRHVDVDRAIAPGDHIQNDLGLDSLGVMELVADIEGRFEVDIPTSMFDGLA